MFYDVTRILYDVARILEELFHFDGQIEDMCIMSEQQGEFDMTAEEMIDTLKKFVQLFK